MRCTPPAILLLLALAGSVSAQSASQRPAGNPPPAPSPRESIGAKPLTELGEGMYKGETGGLYGHGRNEPPEQHQQAAGKAAAEIQPLDGQGRPSVEGKIVLLSIGMSNTTQEFSLFKTFADGDPQKSPRVVIVDGAQGGKAAEQWTDPQSQVGAEVWQTVDARLKAAGVTGEQVQVVWIKQALIAQGRFGEFPTHARKLEQDLVKILQVSKRRFPSLRIAYLSSRIYGGYATTALNPEPYAYEGAYSVRWVIDSQIKGDARLNYDPQRGAVTAPVVLWGPYLWGDGVQPRKSDALVWNREDFRNDGTHPSDSGREKVAKLLLNFLRTDPYARGWFLQSSPVRSGRHDTDGDGLSDFHEIHKYFSDPNKFSTADDGVSDGDWERRREFTYTVRSLIKVVEPVNVDCLNDDYQDARVLARNDNYVELEVIHYPLNTVGETITANLNWRKDAETLNDYVQPGVTTNWDEAMQRDLVAALKAAGIDAEKLDDKELVVQVARWLLDHSKYTNMFCTYYVEFPDGRPAVRPRLEARFEIDKGDPAWTREQQFERELFGRSMFAHRSHGTCTSTAVYLTTVLRALGIPTRMVLAIPLVDATDSAQMAMTRDNLHHHRVRRTVQLGLASAGGYAAHTFNEVFVGGRWVRLNYSKLGQNILDPHAFGILTHVNTFNDLSEAGLAATWGQRYALGERDAVFRHSNPYRADELSDQFGKFAQVENTEAREHRVLTLSRAYWPSSPDAPSAVKDWKDLSKDPQVGYLVAHIEEWFTDESYTQYRIFTQDAAKGFVLQSEGQADVLGSFWGTTTHGADVHELIIRIMPEEFAKMKAGIDYALVPQNGAARNQWMTKGRVVVRKER